jgi:PAS domain S-box-containing protein
MEKDVKIEPQNLLEIEDLRMHVEEAEEVLSAIRRGEVDGLVVSGPAGERVFTLKGAERSYRFFVEAMSEGAVTLALDGTILYCNGRFAEMVSTPYQMIIGGSIYRFLASSKNAFESAFQKAKTESSKTDALLTSGKNGQIPVSLALNSMEEDELPGICMVVTDLTRQKRVENELRSLASDLILTAARERRALASELHDTVAQMLAIAKLTLEATGARLEGKSREELKKAVQLIQEASRQTRSLMADLSPSLLYEAGLGQALRALARRMGELHALAIEVVDDGIRKPLGEDYRVLLYRAVQELLHNTVKHAKATNVKVSVQREGEQLRIEVEDDGVGFLASQRGRGEGMREGFGLFSIEERLRHLGGRFEVFSEPGKGVRAVLVVPLQIEGAGEGREPVAVRILIADDNRMMRDALASLLKEWGFEVVGLAEDGLEAVRLTREAKPDVVLMDVKMPKMDGIEATRQITATLPKIKVIVLSVQSEPHIASNIVAAGACSFVPKSATPEELTEAIRCAVRSATGD